MAPSDHLGDWCGLTWSSSQCTLFMRRASFAWDHLMDNIRRHSKSLIITTQTPPWKYNYQVSRPESQSVVLLCHDFIDQPVADEDNLESDEATKIWFERKGSWDNVVEVTHFITHSLTITLAMGAKYSLWYTCFRSIFLLYYQFLECCECEINVTQPKKLWMARNHVNEI